MRLFFCFLLCLSTLKAELVDQFKPCPNKEAMSSIDGVDFIYMINLDRRPEKYEKSCKLLKPYGIVPYRFSAVDGWSLSVEDLWDVAYHFKLSDLRGVMGTCYYKNHVGKLDNYDEEIATEGKPYFSHCMSPGAIGIVLSHLSVIQDAWDSGYECVWIMEDDVDVHDSPKKISELIEELDELCPDWSILFTDIDTKNNDGKYVPNKKICQRPGCYQHPQKYYQMVRRISPCLREIRLRFGAYSYLIKRDGMEKVLNFFKKSKVFLPYDMDMFFVPDVRMFKSSWDIVSTRIHALSDNGINTLKGEK